MKKNTGTVLSALLLASSSLFAQAANAAVDISSAPHAITLVDTVDFGDKFKNNQKGNFFADKFTFTTTGTNHLELIVTSISTSALNGLNLSDVALYSNDTLVANGTQLLRGSEDKWTLSADNLRAGSYYFQISGDIVSRTGASFGANATLTPVPEPETYAMMMGGLALVGFMARRRKNATAA